MMNNLEISSGDDLENVQEDFFKMSSRKKVDKRKPISAFRVFLGRLQMTSRRYSMEFHQYDILKIHIENSY